MATALRFSRSVFQLVPVGSRWISGSVPALAQAAKGDFLDKYMDVDNMVKKRFETIEDRFQKFYKAQESIEIPLDGDEAKIKSYHNELTKLRKQFGIPDKVKVTEVMLQQKKKSSNGVVRKCIKDLKSALADDVYESVMDLITEVEQETGKELLFPTKQQRDPDGWKQFKTKYKGLMQEHGLNKPMTTSQILFAETKRGLENVKEFAQNTMDDACQKLGLKDKPDASTIRTTLKGDVK